MPDIPGPLGGVLNVGGHVGDQKVTQDGRGTWVGNQLISPDGRFLGNTPVTPSPGGGYVGNTPIYPGTIPYIGPNKVTPK